MDEDRVKAAINARIALYRTKQAKRDPFGDDICNSYELCNYHVEVLQWLAADLGIEVIDPAPHDTDMDTGPVNPSGHCVSGVGSAEYIIDHDSGSCTAVKSPLS